MGQFTVAIWIASAVVVCLIGNFLIGRFFFGKVGARGYWPRALLFTALLGGGIALIFWKMF